MRPRAGWTLGLLLGITIAPMTAACGSPPAQQPQAYRAPRTPDGAPDLNGIWQANNTANWDLEEHAARQGPVIALGAAFSVPPGHGVVEGGGDSVPACGAREEEGERGELDDAGSRGQVLHAGDSARDLHAVPVPDRADARQHPDGVRVRERQPRGADEHQGEPARRRPGWDGR